MRITNSMMVSDFLSDLCGNMNRLTKYQKQETTGKAISSISDDPVKTALSLQARNKLSNIEKYRDNVRTAKDYLTEVEASVIEMNKITADAYETAVSASTGSLTDDDLDAIAQKVAQLRDQVLSVSNATMGDNYLFAGYNTTGASGHGLPFKVDGNGDLYYNGVNMSNEASADNATAAADTAGDALATATTADTAAQATSSADYYNVIKEVSTVTEAVTAVGENAANAVSAARDIALAADIDAVTAASLSAAADAAETAGQEALSAAQVSANAVSLAETAGKAADTAFSAAQAAAAAVPFDAAAAADANAAYTTAAAAAAAAADVAKTASAAAQSKANDAKTAIDTIKTVCDAATAASSTALDIEDGDALSVQVGAGQTMEVSVAGTDLLGRGDENLYVILDDFYNALKSGADETKMSGFITKLQDKQSEILTMETRVGSMNNRLSALTSRYTQNKLNYTQMKSDAEDVDMAEAIMNFAAAKKVYDSALASGAKILQNSLIDFLR